MTKRQEIAINCFFIFVHIAIIFLIIKVEALSWSQGSKALNGDLDLYFTYAKRCLGGEIPYRDYLVEYPLGAFPLLLVPKLLTRTFENYQIAFAAEMLLFDVAAIFLVSRQVRRSQGGGAIPMRLGWYTLFFAVLAPLIAKRYDLAPAVMAFAASSAWASDWRRLGGMLAGLGAITKIFPGFAAVPDLVREIYHPASRRKGLSACLLTVLGGVILWLAIGRSGVMASFYVHGKRGLEIESLYAGILLAVNKMTEMTIIIVHKFGSFNCYFMYYEGLLAIIPSIQLGAILFVAWRYLKLRENVEFRSATAAILAFTILGKVLSPQYLIWLMPFVAVLDGKIGTRARPVFFLCCLLTTVLFPGPGFVGLLEDHTWAILLLNARNLLLILLFFLV